MTDSQLWRVAGEPCGSLRSSLPRGQNKPHHQTSRLYAAMLTEAKRSALGLHQFLKKLVIQHYLLGNSKDHLLFLCFFPFSTLLSFLSIPSSPSSSSPLISFSSSSSNHRATSLVVFLGFGRKRSKGVKVHFRTPVAEIWCQRFPYCDMNILILPVLAFLDLLKTPSHCKTYHFGCYSWR